MEQHKLLGMLALSVVLAGTAMADPAARRAFYGLGPDGQPAADATAPKRAALDALEGIALQRAARERVTAAFASNKAHAGIRVDRVELAKSGVVEVYAELPAEVLDGIRRGAIDFEQLTRVVGDAVVELPVAGFMLYVLNPETGKWDTIDIMAPAEEPVPFVPEPDWGSPPETWNPPVDEKNQFPRLGDRPAGGLSNRTVYLNAGHGWTWRESNFWGLQRGFVHNNIEDFSNADLVHYWMTAYLYNAGADVWNVRETDPNPNMVIVDNDDGAPNYVETGTWSNSSLTGFRNGQMPYVQGQNPFSFGTMRLVQCVVGTPTATATWIPTIPEAGFYNVYVSHGAFTNRSPSAHYRVSHAGGESDYYLDQRRHRGTWIFIGRYYFEAGRNPATGKVVLSNASSSADYFVSADAVRFGGGTGLILRGTVGVSPYRNFDNEASYHLQWMGAPINTVYGRSTNDEQASWSGRPRFAGWLEQQSTAYGSPARSAVFLSNHTNATSDGSARGTISYIMDGITDTSIHWRYRAAVHNQVVRNLRDGYGGAYVVNSNPLRSGSFGEASPSNITSGGSPRTVPIFLGEWIFHDNATDMSLYHDPKFRMLLARGVYQGIVDFWHTELGGPGTYLPEPPRNLRVRNTANNTVTLQWDAPPVGPARANGDAATGYRLYRSTHGRGFPGGTAVTGLTTAVTGLTTTVTGLTPGQTYYFKLTATNAGGESFPTETLAVRIPEAPAVPRVLVVNGFDKLDITTRVQTPWSGNVLYRHFLEQMNSHDYIVEHLRAIAATGRRLAVDSAEHDAVEAQLVTLANYDAVIWIGGLQAEVSTADPTDDTALKTNTRTALANYINGGGRLFLSGAATAWDLNRLNQTSFLNNTLRTGWVRDQTTASTVSGASGSIFTGLSGINFGAGAGSPYRVFNSDVLIPAGGSVAALVYGGGGGTSAQTVDAFDAIGGWRQPSFSSQTNADATSAFSIVTSPTFSGTGSGQLSYVWGAGNFIRLYNSSLPSFAADSDFSIRINGDNSGHQVRICLRDSDNDLLVSDWVTINFTGWRELRWDDVKNNPKNVWVQAAAGNGLIDGPSVRFDGMHFQKLGTANSGNIHLDAAVAIPRSGGTVTGPVAATQWSGTGRVVVMGFPFETISDTQTRTELMGRVLDFIAPEAQSTSGPDGWLVR